MDNKQQLEKDTIDAFVAYRSDPKIEIECVSKENVQEKYWITLRNPQWEKGRYYRIKQGEKTIAVWQEFMWEEFIYVFVPYKDGFVVPMSRRYPEAKWGLMSQYTISVKNTEKITADEVHDFVNLNDSRCKIGNKL